MTSNDTQRDLTLYCAADCDLNHAGIPHSPWDCDATIPAPALTVEQLSDLAEGDLPWMRYATSTRPRRSRPEDPLSRSEPPHPPTETTYTADVTRSTHSTVGRRRQ